MSGASRGSLFGLLAITLVAGAVMQALPQWSRARVGAQVSALARPGDIGMIASETCVYCRMAKAWFDEHGIPFTECMVERDPQCANEYRRLQAPGTPVLLVRGQRLIGFDPEAVAAALR